MIWSSHGSTDVVFGQRMMHDLPTVTAAAMPTSVLPAPHGSTMTPERARPLPNIFESDFCWYGRSSERSRSATARAPAASLSSSGAAPVVDDTSAA